jgi:hypothetical protein
MVAATAIVAAAAAILMPALELSIARRSAVVLVLVILLMLTVPTLLLLLQALIASRPIVPVLASVPVVVISLFLDWVFFARALIVLKRWNNKLLNHYALMNEFIPPGRIRLIIRYARIRWGECIKVWTRIWLFLLIVSFILFDQSVREGLKNTWEAASRPATPPKYAL